MVIENPFSVFVTADQNGFVLRASVQRIIELFWEWVNSMVYVALVVDSSVTQSPLYSERFRSTK